MTKDDMTTDEILNSFDTYITLLDIKSKLQMTSNIDIINNKKEILITQILIRCYHGIRITRILDILLHYNFKWPELTAIQNYYDKRNKS